ncbi:hypothetical protein [Botrimarina sp.]|uniref:hypothetical protein n=1 Tax=Botrimarina sp. TaxID=2795802 RepID=UPI0032EEBF75
MLAPIQLPIAALTMLFVAVSVLSTLLPLLAAATRTDDTMLSSISCDVTRSADGACTADPGVPNGLVSFGPAAGGSEIKVLSAVFLAKKRLYDGEVVKVQLHHATADCSECGRVDLSREEGGRLRCRSCSACVAFERVATPER